MVRSKYGIVGRGQKIFPDDVGYAKSIRRRGESEPKGYSVTRWARHLLTLHTQQLIGSKKALAGRSRAVKTTFHLACSITAIIIDKITIIATLISSHINPISTFAIALVVCGIVVVADRVVTGCAYVSIG